jgi:hypothetical protein
MMAAEIRTRLSVPWRHGDCVDLAGIVCEDRLDLTGLSLTGVDFTGARFPGGIVTHGARFQGVSWFRKSVIEGVADFAQSCFFNDARFEEACFHAPADFSRAEFRGTGSFDNCRLEAGGDFSGAVSYGNFSIARLKADEPLTFRNMEWLGGLWCAGAQLPARADFDETEVHGRLWLRDAQRGAEMLKPAAFGMTFGYIHA